MYLMITSRCNMRCAHCCFDCKRKGEDMSLETFMNALKIDDEYIVIGGGEPTLHPQFERFLLLAIAATPKGFQPFIVTNGSIKERAMMLARLADNGSVDANLSWDNYHDKSMVSDEVYDEFSSMGRLWYDKENNGIVQAGRGAKLKGVKKSNWCCCDTTIVRPNGNVYQCGCEGAPLLGNVNEGDVYIPGCCCYREMEYAV